MGSRVVAVSLACCLVALGASQSSHELTAPDAVTRARPMANGQVALPQSGTRLFEPMVDVVLALLHRVRCTEADASGVGALTVDAEWLEAAGLFAGQRIEVTDLVNGAKETVHVVAGARKSGVVRVSGAPAKLIDAGDALAVTAWASMTRSQYAAFEPHFLIFDDPASGALVRRGEAFVYKSGGRPAYRRGPLTAPAE